MVTWDGIDVLGPSMLLKDGQAISTGKACEGTTITGLNEEWMLEVWGEEIQERGSQYIIQ